MPLHADAPRLMIEAQRCERLSMAAHDAALSRMFAEWADDYRRRAMRLTDAPLPLAA